ncbi:cupin domain-containing protein [Pedomonas sp. V897]|mgnify:CR=1 FL=1|uniref:cupin domain-containing protein n=1 Tax=Pedomonas sp. V897 TaxID=3446482 RepID=UPI003EDE92AA
MADADNRPGRWHVGLAELREQLRGAPQPFVTALAHGTMSVELFAPRGADTQQPHAQDELYIIREGSGWFLHEGERVPVKAGDVLFVRAGTEHRFVDFTPDFETWVIFWGPEGGEA